MNICKKHKKKLKLSKTSQILENYINAEDQGATPELPWINNGKDVSRNFANSAFLKEIKTCPDCKRPSQEVVGSVIICYTDRGRTKKITVCKNHWVQLSEMQLGWTSTECKPMETLPANKPDENNILW